MGKKDTIHMVGGTSETAVNIHFPVGPGVENGPADVKTIQTLFRFLANHSKHSSITYFDLRPDQLPSVSGRCGYRTQRAILNFQRKHARRLQRVDGLIHPASYEGRTLKGGTEKRWMTITLLHFFAVEVVRRRAELYRRAYQDNSRTAVVA